MTQLRQPRYTQEEFARRGDEIYEREIRPRMETTHTNQFVAIDIETGAWETDPNDYTATERLLQKIPDAQIWLAQVGSLSAYRIGGKR